MFLRRRWIHSRILLAIPGIWFICIVFFTYDAGLNGTIDDEYGENKVDRIGRTMKEESKYGEVRVIQGFGPPMPVDISSTATNSKTPTALREHQPDRVTKSKSKTEPATKQEKFVIDWNSAIYKQDPNLPGENGEPVVINKNDMTAEQRQKFDDGWANNAFNQYASDMISVRRSLPIPADPECFNETYPSDLPDTSVVICFHNEAWSVLLRTVHSVLDRTPQHLLNEIILVDDFSDKDHLKDPLTEYMSKFEKVKLLRLNMREGLIRARLKGFEIAQGKAVTFLDSHCECTQGWIEPLLSRIKADPRTVVCPVIDVIDEATLQFHYGAAHMTNVGGFDWSLQFSWHTIPERVKKQLGRPIDPIPSPTMAGGLFAIDKAFFEYLGTYDPGFDIWGGENLELSFKVWMCGGRLEIVPCSHVGHIFRKRSPYKWRSGVNVLKRNTVRLAEVWLDDYKRYYYERINWQMGDYGNVSDRVELRQRINCTSFKWYLDNVYPEIYVPGESVAQGEIRTQAIGRVACIDSSPSEDNNGPEVRVYRCQESGGNQLRNKGGGSKMCLDWGKLKGGRYQGPQVGLYWCHGIGGNQFWMLSPAGEIRRDEQCLDYAGQEVMIYKCHGLKGNQEWRYDHNQHQIYHVPTRKCLEMTKDGARLRMDQCEPINEFQQWVFKEYDLEKAKRFGLVAVA